MIFAKGDYVRYHGGVLVEGGVCLINGDEVFVTQANTDLDDEVTIVFENMTFMVGPEDLEWIHGG